MGAFEYVSAKRVPVNSMIPRAIFLFTFKFDDEAHIRGRKHRFNYPGNRFKPDIHFE